MYLFLFFAVLILDQLSKYLILQIPTFLFPITVTPFFDLVFVANKGVSFSMLTSDNPSSKWVLAGLSVLVCLMLSAWFVREQKKSVKIALTLILAGAVGNIIDRLRFGAVVDFLDFYAYDYHWPAFNIADSMICCGVFLIILDALFLKEKKR